MTAVNVIAAAAKDARRDCARQPGETDIYDIYLDISMSIG
jgi:hypothetical protein